MTTFSLKLPESLLREIAREAEARSVAKSAVVRDCIERVLHRGKKSKKALTCLDLMGNRVGSFHGPRHLSTNRAHLVKAINAHVNRGRKSNS